MKYKEWTDVTFHTELLMKELTLLEEGTISSFMLGSIQASLRAAVLNEDGTTCGMCRKDMHRGDTRWKKHHASPMCEGCFSDLAKYGCS